VHVSRKNFNYKDFNSNNNRKQYRVMWKDDQYYDAFIVQIGGEFYLLSICFIHSEFDWAH